MKVAEILRVLARGSHRQLEHPSKIGRVTVPGKPATISRLVR